MDKLVTGRLKDAAVQIGPFWGNNIQNGTGLYQDLESTNISLYSNLFSFLCDLLGPWNNNFIGLFIGGVVFTGPGLCRNFSSLRLPNVI